MRILMVSEWSPCSYGGIASQVNLLSRWLSEHGYEVVVAYKQGTCSWEKYCVKVEGILPLEMHIVPPVLWKVKETIKRVKPDIVHVHHSFTPFSVLAVRACNKLGIPCVLTNHSLPPLGDIQYWTMLSYVNPYKVLLRPTIVTAVSRSAGEFIKEVLGYNIKVRIVPNAVDTSKFRPNTGRRKDYVLYVGRLVRRKGVHVLIDAFKILRRNGLNTELLIAGKGYFEKFLRIKASGVKGIRFLGEISEEEKVDLYSRALVSVLPSVAGESFGVVILESFASGTPVVATRIGGIPEIIDDGVDGLLVEPGDSRALANALERILKSQKLWSRLSENALKKCIEKYSIDKVGRSYEDVYYEAIEVYSRNIVDTHYSNAH